MEPTASPTAKPTQRPTTTKPTVEPTMDTASPSRAPTEQPTPLRTEEPTERPTLHPTAKATAPPTPAPTHPPTDSPSPKPSTVGPTLAPSTKKPHSLKPTRGDCSDYKDSTCYFVAEKNCHKRGATSASDHCIYPGPNRDRRLGNLRSVRALTPPEPDTDTLVRHLIEQYQRGEVTKEWLGSELNRHREVVRKLQQLTAPNDLL